MLLAKCAHRGLYACQDWDNHRIRKIDLKSGETTTLAGTGIQGFNDGVSTSAQFSKPMGIAIDPKGNFALVGVCLSPIPASRASASHTRPTPAPHLSELRDHTATLCVVGLLLAKRARREPCVRDA